MRLTAFRLRFATSVCFLALLVVFCDSGGHGNPVENVCCESPTEGRLTGSFVPEPEMMRGMLEAIARFSKYMVDDYRPCLIPNRDGDCCGCFQSRKTMTSTEDGVRTNADLSMLCAFLVKYGQPLGVELPRGVSYRRLERLAGASLVYAYSTHKAVRLKRCKGGDWWGSTSVHDSKWESSLWSFSVAWSAFFQWDKLSEKQKKHIHSLLAAECNYELEREIPTGYAGNTRAEENGWEVCVLAAALGLFPEDTLAPKWFARMREFAVNSYSHPGDSLQTESLDTWYDSTSAAALFKGPNLYEDYTLQNHGFFHSSYQNVVIQELGEAALALSLFQKEQGREERWHSRALFHNVEAVMDSVLVKLALADGELAMPNGNDWSLYLFDQITSYTTLSTFLRSPDALMLENLAYKNILARQSTTDDGSWLLRPDIGARRMGVQGHRMMMSWLMHRANSTVSLVPAKWEEFRAAHAEAALLPCQEVVRSYSPDRYVCFSYSRGLNDFSGYISSNSPDKNKVFVPFRKNGTGNIIGWYDVRGKNNNAVLAGSPFFALNGNEFVTGATLLTNDASLENQFALYATPGNAVLYADRTTTLDSCVTITGERGLVAAISVDAFTSPVRTLSYADRSKDLKHQKVDGTSRVLMEGTWANVDGYSALVVRGGSAVMAFGDKEDNHSILTAKLYGSFCDSARMFKTGECVGTRAAVFYTDISPAQTALLDEKVIKLDNGLIAVDPDGTSYLLVFNPDNHRSSVPVEVEIDLAKYPGAPVFGHEITVKADSSATTLSSTGVITLEGGKPAGDYTRIYVRGDNFRARRDSSDRDVLYLRSLSGACRVAVTVIDIAGFQTEKTVLLPAGGKEVTLCLPEDGGIR